MRFSRVAGACLCAAALAPTGALTQDATWRVDAPNGLYNLSSNWTPATIPRGGATFGATQTSSIFFSGGTMNRIGAFTFTADAPAYVFNPTTTVIFGQRVGSEIIFDGAGIRNSSPNAHTFLLPFGAARFWFGSGAGNAIFNLSCQSSLCGQMEFSGTSSAADARINNSGGSVTFSEFSTAVNATIINSGSIQFSGNASAGGSTIINQGTLTFTGNGTTAFDAVINNTGGVVSFAGARTGNAVINNTSGGRLTISGSFTNLNELSNTARIIADRTSEVTFQNSGSSSLLTSVGSLEGAGTFRLANATVITGANNLSTEISGTITGIGRLFKVNGGTLTLSGGNSLGRLDIAGGTVAATHEGALGASNASLVFGDRIVATDLVRTVVVGGSRGTLKLLSSFNLSAGRTIQVLQGGGTIDTNGFDMTIAPGISGNVGTLIKAGDGTLTLNGTNTLTAATVVTGGTLVVNGSMAAAIAVTGGSAIVNGSVRGNSSVNGGSFIVNGTGESLTVNSGTGIVNGTLSGNVINGGTFGGSGLAAGNVSSSGTLSPGNSIGTLRIGGTLSSSGNYRVETGGAQSDLLSVGGTATLGGGTVMVQPLTGLSAARTTYTILSAAGGLSGTFASATSSAPFLQPSLSYDANNAYLTLQVGGFAAQAQNPLQYAVGSVLDANVNNATGDFATVLGSLGIATVQQGQAFMTAISGNNYAGFSSSMVQGAQLFMNNFANQTGGGGSPVSNRVALAEACDVACDATTPPKWGAWGGALGGLGTIGASQPVGSVTYNAGGFAAGLDRAVTDSFRLGVTAGYTTGTQWVSGFDGLGRTDTFQVGLYGGFAQDKVYADALIGYAYSWNQMWRNIPIPGLPTRTAQGRTGANQWYGQIETGYRFDLGTNANAFVIPFARLQAYTANQNAFTETGAQSLNLSVAQQQTNSLRSVIGAQLGGSMDLGWREKLLMQLRLGWSHEYADTARPVTATLAGAPVMPFTTFGVAPQRDGVVLGLSANTAIAEATSIYLRYEGDISGQDSAHAVAAGVRMTW